MSGDRLRNFIGGEYVDAKDGRTLEVVDPSTGETYAQAPVSGAEDVDAAFRAAAGRSPPGATPRRASGASRCSASRTRWRRARRNS